MTVYKSRQAVFDDDCPRLVIKKFKSLNGILHGKYSFPECNQGFTLLEVMISVSIIAFIFVSVFRMQSGTIDLAISGKFNGMAPMLAKNLLNDAGRDIDNWSEFEGDFGENFPGIQWRMDVSDSFFEMDDFIGEDNQARFKKIKIEIIKSSGFSGTKIYTMTTWRLADE
ncbi:MAG: prepilin-type N-terminal cleavage/methylation domain-containing protein [Desulfobacula sp.]|nr:prepilin-type N-terminal cleavage/methylation domain-containing protein [Desulfobacula sp.]